MEHVMGDNMEINIGHKILDAQNKMLKEMQDNSEMIRLQGSEELEAGARDFEKFWLRPKNMANKEVVLRMKINKRWGGWKLKDELVQSIGLVVGDTINTEVSVLHGPGLIANADDTDLFADGLAADWLLNNNVGVGSIIDAKVRFMYCKAPVGGLESRDVWKISLVMLEGYNIIQEATLDVDKEDRDGDFIMREFLKMISAQR